MATILRMADEVPPLEFCHYPAHPAPVEVSLPVSAEHECSYFPDRVARTRAVMARRMPPALYHAFMDAGFRRSGTYIYQPACAGCRACIPIRVPVEQFRASKSQRRCWRKNQDLEIQAAAPRPTREKHELYEAYREGWHGHTEPPDWEAFVSFLYDSPVETVEFSYRDPGGKLVGVGLCDICRRSLSTVYFYFDPAEARRGPGTFSALKEIDLARRMGIPHYYLGFWVGGCPAMEYKADFRPYELLGLDGVWRRGGE